MSKAKCRFVKRVTLNDKNGEGYKGSCREKQQGKCQGSLKITF